MKILKPFCSTLIVCLFLLLSSILQASIPLSWTKYSGPWDASFDGSFNALALHPSNPSIIYIGNGNLGPGVFKSTDGGASWIEKNSGITKLGLFTSNYPPISKIVVSASNPNILYLGTAIDDPVYAGGRGDVYRSGNGGDSWTKVDGPSWLGISQLHGSIFGLDVDPQNANVVFAGVTGQGIYKSIDGGTSWTQKYSATAVIGAVDYFNVVRVSPNDSNTIYFSGFTAYYEDVIPLPTRDFDTIGTDGVIPSGLRKSTDGGSTWTSISPPASLVVNPPLITSFTVESSTGNLYLGTLAYQTPVFFSVGNKGFYKSSNDGATWVAINSSTFGDLGSTPIYSMTAELNSSRKGIFSSGGFPGILTSEDEGVSWQLLVGLPQNSLITNVCVLNQKLYVVTSSGVYGASTVPVIIQPPITISAVSPRILNTQAIGQTQPVTITGTNFTSSSRLTFNDGVNPPYTGKVPVSWSATQLVYNIAVGPNPGSWTVKVVNGSVESLPYPFSVVPAGAVLTGVSITGAASVAEGAFTDYTAKALFSDGTTPNISPTWSVTGPATISTSGRLTAGSVSSDTVVTVTATYQSGSVSKSSSKAVTIINSVTGGGTTQELLTNGDFSQGSTGWQLTANFYADNRFGTAHSPGGYAYLSTSTGAGGNNLYGELAQTVTIPANATQATLSYWVRITTQETANVAYDSMTLQILPQGGTVTAIDTRTNLNANTAYELRSFDVTQFKGQQILIDFAAQTDPGLPTVFRVDDVSLTVTLGKTLAFLLIDGPTQVQETQGAQYRATAVFSDSTTADVSSQVSWYQPSGYASISSSGYLTTYEEPNTRSFDIQASYTYAGITKTTLYNIFILNVAPVIVSLEITGPTEFDENTTQQYQATAYFSDGSSRSVTSSAGWSSDQGQMPVSASGSLTVGNLPADTIATLTATYADNGVTQSTQFSVRARNIPDPVVFTGLQINGPSSVGANTTALYTATALFSDGSSQIVVPAWSENSTATSISIFGLLSAGNVLANTSITVSANATLNGVTRSANQAVVIVAQILPPTVTINQAAGQSDPTGASPINFTVVFSEVVTGFDGSDVTLGGTAGATSKSVSGSGATYNVAISGMVQDGTVTASIPAGAAQDAAGNGSLGSSSADNTVTYVAAGTTPTVTINQASGQSDPTGISPINFTVVFSQAVTGFVSSGVILGGTAGATTKIVTGSGTTYNVAVSGMSQSGTVTAGIPVGAAQNAAGNGNLASTSTDDTVVYNNLTVFSDNFSSGILTPSKWSATGNTVSVASQIMRVETTVTDAGGTLTSVPFSVASHSLISISRRVNLHYANSFFSGLMNVQIGTLPLFGIHYENYSYTGPYDIARYGFFLMRNGANSHGPLGQADTSAAIPAVWDAWFNERLTYDTDTGIAEYFINDVSKMTFNVGILPATANPTMTLSFGAWGWWTGHYQWLDDLVVTQAVGSYQRWQASNFGAQASNGLVADNNADPDGDGSSNLMEFAFGTPPMATNGGAITLSGSGISQRGAPTPWIQNIPNGVDFRALFGRRKDYLAAGLTYTVLFSGDLVDWQASTATPILMGSDGEIDAVWVPYPFFVNGRKARFFKVQVTSP